ncbi:hypothetical protein RFI_23264 [Reticulomyxa filosa]|uniref:Uncharacterized protein n=1 Tax=Reticulomyxa filosa TaxID=46433 RepID=X6MJB1_RETFI|nr:hypothetical protein RFI_23264 [Reticulomyxa filosa]|eukprot:ETO14103.1 hypothetical protein RFI_23264 [Reticulomyxa filosa]
MLIKNLKYLERFLLVLQFFKSISWPSEHFTFADFVQWQGGNTFFFFSSKHVNLRNFLGEKIKNFMLAPSSPKECDCEQLLDLESPNVLSEPVPTLDLRLSKPDTVVTPFQRVVSASIGALITSLVVTPFDVIKTRMQVANGNNNNNKKKNNDNKRQTMELDLIPLSLEQSTSAQRATETIGAIGDKGQTWYTTMTTEIRKGTLPSKEQVGKRFAHSLDAAMQIAKYEGVSHLYTGLSVTLWMAVPATVIYFTTYDVLRHKLSTKVSTMGLQSKHNNNNNNNNNNTQIATVMMNNNGSNTWIPLVCGIISRTIAVCVISPLELLKTQMQARTINRNLSIYQATLLNARAEGVRSLWKGVAPTLWRDVPFSGIYWMGYEFLKSHLYSQLVARRTSSDAIESYSPTMADVFRVGFCAGAVSGIAASIVTHPFDVVKTRRQALLIGLRSTTFNATCNLAAASRHALADADTSFVRSLQMVLRTAGPKGLFAGITARLAKVPLACAIMISVYEAGKFVLNQM